MANIVLNSDPAGNDITFYGTEKDALAAGSSLVFVAFKSQRVSPWEPVEYPGLNAIRAKFQGARVRMHTIIGNVINTSEVTMRTELDKVMALNASQVEFTVSAGGILLHDGGGMICDTVESDFLGMGTGPLWKFVAIFRDLGTT